MQMRNYEASTNAEGWREDKLMGLEDQLDIEDRRGTGLGSLSSFRIGKLVDGSSFH